MRYLALFSCPIFIYVALTQQGSYVWGRWVPAGGQPNWWGMMSLGLAWSAFAWKSTFVRMFFLTIAFYFMIKTESRGSIVAFLPVLIFSSGYFLPLTKKRIVTQCSIFILGVVAIIGLSCLTSNDLFGNMLDYLSNNIMKMNDPNRGLGSGMTGRTTNYIVAWNEFIEHPIFGIGFSQTESVHNGFLATLAESGIFAFIGMMWLFIFSLRGYTKSQHLRGVGFVLSYMALISTFPRTFNINMTALLFMIILMRGIALRHTDRSTSKDRPEYFVK